MSFPNTLTIFINTRIRGYPKIKYEPEMTVPKIKSDTVYFNPLIKLNKAVSLRIPPGYPENEKFTQFFNKSDFNGLVGRNMSAGFQKKLTIDEAAKNGIVDNNINVTLDILFKKNNRFYIKDTPYTIFSHEWIAGDWRVDKKSFEKQIALSTYGQGLYGNQQTVALQNKMADDELTKFKKEHAEAMSGFAASSDISKFKDDYIRGVARGVNKPQEAVVDLSQKAELQAKTEIPKIARKLATKKLVYQNIVNLDEDANLSNDPVSINILYSIDRNYSEDIKLKPKVLEPLYQTLLKKGTEYKNAKDVYDKSIGEYYSVINLNKTTPVAIPVEESEQVISGGSGENEGNEGNVFNNKSKYDEAIKQINIVIQGYKEKNFTYQNVTNDPQIKNEMLKILILLEKYKAQFLNSFLDSLKLLVRKIKSQISYIKALYAFYSQLYIVKESDFKKNGVEKDYQNVLKLNIIKFDVQCYKNIIYSLETTESNPLSDNFKTIVKMVAFVEKFIQRENATPKNYAELLKNYYDHPNLLEINRYQFDVYMFSLLKYDFTNDLGMWKILYRQTDVFLNSIKEYIIGGYGSGSQVIEGKIAIAKMLFDQYNEKYTKQQRDSLIKNVSQLKKPLQKQNPNMLDFAFPDNASLKQQQNDYVRYQTAITLCYDLITIYSRISAIKYSREISLVASRQNLCYVLDKIYKRMIKSYELILDEGAEIVQLIPNYIYLKADSYKDHTSLKNNIKITSGAQLINKNKNAGFKILMRSLRKKYHEAVDMLIPEITKLGILESCKKLVNSDEESDSDDESVLEDDPESELTPGEIFKKEYQQNMERHYDTDNSLILKKHLANLYVSGVKEGSNARLSDDEFDEMINSWSVVDNAGGGDCLFLAVAELFNSELINNNKQSNNLFADENGYFSKTSLRRAVADETYGIQPSDTIGWNNGVKPVIENVDASDPTAVRMRQDYGFLFDEKGKWIGNNIQALRSVIRQDSKYWGDDVAIKILERIFKIKFIIIDTTAPGVFPKGTEVRYSADNGLKKIGVVLRSARVGNTDEYLYDIQDPNNPEKVYPEISSVDNDVTLAEDGYYRIVSLGSDNKNANDFSQYAFLLLTTVPGGAQHYEIMYSNELNKFIYTFEEIPDYLKYLVYKTQWKYLDARDRLETWYGKNNAFRNYLFDAEESAMAANARKRRPNSNKLGGGGGLKDDDDNVFRGGERSGYINVNNGTNVKNDDSKLSYYIIIDLELYPGESIPLLKQPVIACHLRYEKIRQAFADMFGLYYNPIDFYQQGHVAPSSIKYKKDEDSKGRDSMRDYNTRRFNVSYAGGKKTRRHHR